MFHAFPKSISWKVNMIARLEFELAYFEATVQHVSHYTTGTHFIDLKHFFCVGYLKSYKCVLTNEVWLVEKNVSKNCCILTFDRAGCSNYVNNGIARCTCVNKWKRVNWMTTGIRGRCEIIYTRQTTNKGSLAWYCLQSRFLNLEPCPSPSSPSCVFFSRSLSLRNVYRIFDPDKK